MSVEENKAATFADIYNAHARDVYRYAYYLSGDASTAQDVTSEAFLRIWMSAEPIRVSTVKSYLFVIARNLYLHQLRHTKRQQPLDETLTSKESVETSAEARQALARTMQAMAALPEIDRAALVLRTMEGLPYEEIAAILKISIAAAKVKVHRARLRLGAYEHVHA